MGKSTSNGKTIYVRKGETKDDAVKRYGKETNKFQKQAEQNIKGLSGYKVTNSNGETTEFYFYKSNGNTYYGNSINTTIEETPNGWTEKQMIERIKNSGGTAEKYSKNKLLNTEIKRLEDREKIDKFLNQETARNRGADVTNKGYRNTRKAGRIARRTK